MQIFCCSSKDRWEDLHFFFLQKSNHKYCVLLLFLFFSSKSNCEQQTLQSTTRHTKVSLLTLIRDIEKIHTSTCKQWTNTDTNNFYDEINIICTERIKVGLRVDLGVDDGGGCLKQMVVVLLFHVVALSFVIDFFFVFFYFSSKASSHANDYVVDIRSEKGVKAALFEYLFWNIFCSASYRWFWLSWYGGWLLSIHAFVYFGWEWLKQVLFSYSFSFLLQTQYSLNLLE